ncbi:DegV family protein [Miniphocaeibacter massiliensis]|uniref:DegV family protein n=1 Tax=Miniphocaeibacter massiliensis TaxID=2041841 RepID=UPI000C07A946|nr:DegV family protein [Miniphocaeibacter massiliensis]
MKINIVTDSTATLPLEYIEKENIHVFQIYYNFEGKEYEEGDPTKYDLFYEKFIESEDFPTTSQPPIGKLIEIFNKALENNPDAVIVMPISEKLSGTYNSCILAKEMIGDERIHIYNAKTTTLNLKRQVEYVVELRNKNFDIDEILKRLKIHRENQSVYFIPESLEYLKRGGRLSSTSATIGDLLNIKPIVSVMEDGSLGLIEKVRGFNKAMNKIESFIPEDIKYLSVVYVYNKEKAMNIYEKMQQKYPNIDVKFEEVSSVIGCHIGPGTIGVLFGTYLDLE